MPAWSCAASERRALLLAALFLCGSVQAADTCSYHTWRWNTLHARSVDHHMVAEVSAALRPQERDPVTGCTVCEQDQTWVAVAGAPRVRLCQAIAAPVASALRAALAQGARIVELTGYRPGYTRGALDRDGNRTVFSNHSFGVALDVNASHNGLYDDCPAFGPACRLRRGGPWRADDPLGLRASDPLVQALQAAGLKWGGQIAGVEKDLMHFSPTGY